jgi:hypothetical protein
MKVKLGDEFLLTAACCRWPPSPERDETVRAAASQDIDWSRFLRIVRRQRVEGLVSDALTSAGVSAPANVVALLDGEAHAIARQNLAFAAESLRLKRLFETAELPFLFVKGATLDMLAYGTLGLKRARDIDLVVASEAVEQACELLAQAGYARTLPGPEVGSDKLPIWLALCKETGWRHPRNGIILELHTGLVDNPRLMPRIDARSPRQWVAIAPGIELPTLARDELFAYLCVHGATHAWSRMKWIADLAALLKDAESNELERLYRRSLTLGVGRCSAQALLLCERLFDRTLPPGLAAELKADPATRRLVRVALGTMAGRYGETELDDTVLGTVPIHLAHFLLAPGWRYKASEIRRKSLSHHDRAMLPLPRPLHFLYPLMLLPSWLWRRVRGPGPL